MDIKYVEKDGIGVYACRTDKFKSESLSFSFALPTFKDGSVACTLLLSVLKRGTLSYPDQRLLNERLDELYATLLSFRNQRTDCLQLIGVSADAIKAKYTEDGEDVLSEVIKIIAEILLSPRLDESEKFIREYVKSEKENYKSIILSQMNEPRTYAAIRCREEAFASLGTVDRLSEMCEKIDLLSDDDLMNTWKKIRDGSKIIVFYVGERSEDEVLSLVRSAIPDCVGRNIALAVGNAVLLDDVDEPNEIIETSSLSQGRLVMAFNCRTARRDADYYAMLLCNEILGASPVSKLMMNVREELSLCYECSSVYNSARGVIFVSAGIDPESYGLAREAILAQIEDMQNGKISADELEAAKKTLTGVYESIPDSQSAIERFYLGELLSGADTDIDGFIGHINALTLGDVVRAAKRLKLHTSYFLKVEEEGDE